jgi:dienelactone hydrolase
MEAGLKAFLFTFLPVLSFLSGSLHASADVDFPLPASPPRSLSPLALPQGPSELGAFSQPEMAIYMPEGKGPFPALVLGPSCGGVKPHLLYWARQGVQAGYVVLVLDMMTQRGEKNICARRSAVTFLEGTKDALDALEHLTQLSYVDKRRVAFLGYSWGGGVAYFLSSKSFADNNKITNPGNTRYAAAIGFYPVCYHAAWGAIPTVSFVRPDTDRPMLSLFAEEDHEEPVGECVARLDAAKKMGAPVEWQILPKAAHAWDEPSISGVYTKMPWMKEGGRFRYDAAITEQSKERAFEFLSRIFSGVK